MTSGATPNRVATPSAAWLVLVVLLWGVLGTIAAVGAPTLTQSWPEWPWAFAAIATWGVNGLLLVYAIGAPFRVSRPPILAAGFALMMTAFGSGSYWATIQLYPLYRVRIEYAAWFVAVCMSVALAIMAIAMHVFRRRAPRNAHHLEWDVRRVGGMIRVIFILAAVGTVAALGRIGYIPILSGDPTSARVDFPSIGGVWYRLSMLGGLAALLVAVKAAAGSATSMDYAVGIASLALVGAYGPRFFVALPLGVAALLWDRVRKPLSLRRTAVVLGVVAPMLAFVGYWRQRDQNVALLGPVGLLLYGTLGEFRDLGWALDYYRFGDRFLYGETLGSVVVPLLPAPVWHLVGIDKAAVYAHSSASILADAMGQTTGQRIGLFGEFYMNFGWPGALLGAAFYGLLLAYLDQRLSDVDARQVRGLFLIIAAATAVFALIGQLDMFTSTLTGFGYPLGLVALVTSGRTKATGNLQA